MYKYRRLKLRWPACSSWRYAAYPNHDAAKLLRAYGDNHDTGAATAQNAGGCPGMKEHKGSLNPMLASLILAVRACTPMDDSSCHCVAMIISYFLTLTAEPVKELSSRNMEFMSSLHIQDIIIIITNTQTRPS